MRQTRQSLLRSASRMRLSFAIHRRSDRRYPCMKDSRRSSSLRYGRSIPSRGAFGRTRCHARVARGARFPHGDERDSARHQPVGLRPSQFVADSAHQRESSLPRGNGGPVSSRGRRLSFRCRRRRFARIRAAGKTTGYPARSRNAGGTRGAGTANGSDRGRMERPTTMPPKRMRGSAEFAACSACRCCGKACRSG